MSLHHRTWGGLIAHWMGWLCILAITFAVATASVMLNWQLGNLWFGTDPIDFDPRALTVAGIDVIKLLLPTALSLFVLLRLWHMVAATLAGLVVATLLSAMATHGVFTAGRMAVLGEQEAAQQLLDRWAIQRAEKASQRAALGHPRPVEMIASQMAGERQSWRWTSTKGCTDVTASASRSFCSAYASLMTELAGANKAAQLDGEVETLDAKIAKALAGDVSEVIAPDLAMIMRLTGFERQGAVEFRALLATIVIEVFGIVFATLAWTTRPFGGGPMTLGPDPQPIGSRHRADAPTTSPTDAPTGRKPTRRTPGHAVKPKRQERVATDALAASSTDASDTTNVVPFESKNDGPTDALTEPPVAPSTDALSTKAKASAEASVVPLVKPSVATSGEPSAAGVRCSVAAWISERVHKVTGVSEAATSAYDDYVRWAARRGLAPVSIHVFGRRVREAGIKVTRAGANGSRVYHGIRLADEFQPATTSGMSA